MSPPPSSYKFTVALAATNMSLSQMETTPVNQVLKLKILGKPSNRICRKSWSFGPSKGEEGVRPNRGDLLRKVPSVLV